jgi:DNA-binding LacI/PurR family transcriptional regulator
MQEAELPIRREYCMTGGLKAEFGYDCGLTLLRLSESPTAVFCSNNKVLLGFMRALGEAGVRCPQQISVVGFDEFAWTENFHPALTTVAQPALELGRRAMQMLLSRIESDASGHAVGECQKVVLAPKLRIRASTAAMVETCVP